MIKPIKSSKTILNDFGEYEFFSEGGRAVYFYPLLLIVNQYTEPKHPDCGWLLDSECVLASCKNHVARWYFVAKNWEKWQRHLNRFLKIYETKITT